MSDGVAEGSQDSDGQLLDLALLQGNRFIKELLRSKKLPIGTNKEQFEQHLREAISGGQLTRADVLDWLRDVEGWGNQHVFVFAPPDADHGLFHERAAFSAALTAGGLGDLLDAEIPLSPGDQLALSTIRHTEHGVSFLWVRGSPARIRRKELDFEEERDGDEIEFRAYERRWPRVAARFEWRFASNVAAVFLTRSEERNYTQQRDVVLQTADAIIPSRGTWVAIDISRVITRLDSLGLNPTEAADAQSGVRMNSTVFQGPAATVRLASTSESGGYQDDAAVRQVRLAVDTAQLVGGSGDCYLTPEADSAETRELHIRLYGHEGRVLLWGKMSADEVWRVVTDLRTYAAA